MKNFIFLWACLAIINATTLQATDTDSTLVADLSVEPTTDKTVDSKTAVKTKKIIALIPDRTLTLEMISEKRILKVDLSGAKGEMMSWTIFQPYGAVFGQIDTAAQIDEIKLSNMNPGKYVLMVKDTEGRILHQPFVVD